VVAVRHQPVAVEDADRARGDVVARPLPVGQHVLDRHLGRAEIELFLGGDRGVHRLGVGQGQGTRRHAGWQALDGDHGESVAIAPCVSLAVNRRVTTAT
jgi:hypothetical protein